MKPCSNHYPRKFNWERYPTYLVPPEWRKERPELLQCEACWQFEKNGADILQRLVAWRVEIQNAIAEADLLTND